jgi:hypothetical protein
MELTPKFARVLELMAKTLNPITYPSKRVMPKKDQMMASIAKQIEERIKTMTP